MPGLGLAAGGMVQGRAKPVEDAISGSPGGETGSAAVAPTPEFGRGGGDIDALLGA